MVEDQELIRQYAVERSEAAFAELVRRHLNMVYGAALRQVNGDTHLAEDLAQTVFTSLAAKAATLQGARSIAGWLYHSTRFAAVKAVRAEARRRAREQSVVSMNEMNSNTKASWNGLRPMIDEALSELSQTDREAIVLRYFESLGFSQIGMALGVSEDAARMRVDRALEKLRAVLQKRGLTTTGAVLAGALAESSAATAPVHLAAGITAAALMQSAETAAPSILQFMAAKKLILAAAGLSALSLAAVLFVRQMPPATTSSDVAARLKTAAASASETAKPAPFLNITKGDPDLFRKLAQRHDAQVRAREAQAADERRAAWDKKVAEFDDTLKEEQGIKKFGAKIQATFGPGESLVASGWRTAEGKNGVVFVTPQMNPQMDGAVFSSNQVLIAPQGIEVADEVLDRLGMASFKAQPNRSNPPAKFSTARAEAMLESITNVTGSDSVFSPRAVIFLGYEGSVSAGTVAVIAGQQQHLGLQINFFPTRSADGSSLDLAMLVRYAVSTAGGDATAEGQ